MISPIKIRITDRDKNFNLKGSVSPTVVVIYDINLCYSEVRSVLFKWKESISKYFLNIYGHINSKIYLKHIVNSKNTFVKFYGKFINSIYFKNNLKKSLSIFFLKPYAKFKTTCSFISNSIFFGKYMEKLFFKSRIDSNFVMLFSVLKFGYWCGDNKTLGDICYKDISTLTPRTFGETCYDEIKE